uniref:Uncharacterized protein n=1 Tax=Clytia hemisphaerica TaxID=252671 RepID=A0A7M5TRX2_9CNID|eukprot:TCONS_00011893-protein
MMASNHHQIANATEMLTHFIFGQHGHDFRGFPARCFVRYRFGGDVEWETFWERKRDGDELDLERDDSDWEDDKELKRPLHAEKYVIRRIQKAVDDHDSESDSESDSDEGDEFDVTKYSYTCYPHYVHLHYPARNVYTRQFDQVRDNFTEVECFYDQNILYDKNKTFTCYNPQRVVIGKVEYEDTNTPKIVICDSLKTKGNLQWNRDVKAWDGNHNRDLPKRRVGILEIEIYLNASPCEDCFTALKEFVEKNTHAYIHVKYTSFYYTSDQDHFNDVNSETDSRLKITPFTDSDWKFVIREINELQTNKIKRLEKKVKNLEKDLENAEEKLENAEEELENAEEKLEDTEEDLSNRMTELHMKDQKLKDAKKTNKSLTKTVETLERRNKTASSSGSD